METFLRHVLSGMSTSYFFIESSLIEDWFIKDIDIFINLHNPVCKITPSLNFIFVSYVKRHLTYMLYFTKKAWQKILQETVFSHGQRCLSTSLVRNERFPIFSKAGAYE